jgi:primosomal replication protein N''
MLNTPHEITISRLSMLIEHLSVQAKQTDQLNSKHKSHRLIENNALFSRYLFTTESDKIYLYVEEVKKRLSEFSRLYRSSDGNTNKKEFAKSSLQHIVQQITALMNAIQANPAMHQAAQASFDTKKKVRIKSAQAAQLKQNDRPRKKLNYKTSAQLMAEHMVAIAA